MKKEAFKAEALFFGCIAIAGITIEGILLFRPMANIYLIDMILLNTVTIGLAVWKYVWNDSHIRKGNAVAGVVLYAIMRIAVLPLQAADWGESIPVFMFGEGWPAYIEGVKLLLKKASCLGTSEYLHNSSYIHEWLIDRNKPLLQILYYGGWIPVIILVGLLICLILAMIGLLGIKNGRVHRNWLIFATTAAFFTKRIICGILFNFGVPIPVSLPFIGRPGFVMDVMYVTLLFISAFENNKIQAIKNMERYFVPAEKVVGEQSEYVISDKREEPYETLRCRLFRDKVSIVTETGNIVCNADRYELGSKEYGVFTYTDSSRQKTLFILQMLEGKWILPEDPDGKIRQAICDQHAACKRPDCMEAWEDYLDESTGCEDD